MLSIRRIRSAVAGFITGLACLMPALPAAATNEVVLSVAPLPGLIYLSWPGSDGCNYQLQWSTNPPAWQPYTNLVGAGVLLEVCASNVGAAGYRRLVATQSLVVSNVNLDRLFAPPTSNELNQVLVDWAGRDIGVHNFKFVTNYTDLDGGRVHVVSHQMDGTNVHYGAVRVPPGPTNKIFAVLLDCHGGQAGVSDDRFNDTVFVRTNFIHILPTFRAEELRIRRGPFLTNYLSTGIPSVQDRDADDTLALLAGVLKHFPQANRNRIAAHGTSRGANVALRVAIREPRIRAVVDYFGATDFLNVTQRTEFYLSLTVSNYHGSSVEIRKNIENVLDPLQAGTFTMEQARHQLLLQSPLYFARSLPHTQVHHGDHDTTVYPINSVELNAVMTQPPLSRGPLTAPSFEYYSYLNGLHAVPSLTNLVGVATNSLVIRDDFLRRRVLP